MRGAVRGLELFAHGVFPALFPFSVCIGCLKRLGFFDMRESGGFFALLRLFFLGALAGNPTGSMMLATIGSESEGRLSAAERSVYTALFNLASPVFIIGTVGSRLFAFRSQLPALLLLMSHYISALLLFSLCYVVKHSVGKVRRAEAYARASTPQIRSLSSQDVSLISVFPSALLQSITTMLKLCGTIVFFVSLTELFMRLPLLSSLQAPIRPLAVGMLEMTNGLSLIASSSLDLRSSLSLACFIMSFGGICIFMQANAVSPVRAGVYIAVKLAHGFFAALICFLAFPLFISGSVSVMGSGSERLLERTLTTLQIALLCFISSASAALSAIFISKITRA
ncbi:MAG: hypothetical protein IKZ82_10455 [Clostridia bacterium]|nr:hypothetical protein [Clostridia bacterium]